MDIVVKNLTKKYGLQKAIDDLSFTVKTGEILGFLGPNGAGKTTTMNAITTYLVPDAGSISVGGYTLEKNKDEIKKHIGYLPEDNPLYEDMPIIDYLRFVAKLHSISSSMMEEKIGNVIETCGLEREKHKRIIELSKGYRQRVGLAQALIHDPDVLILDEPTVGLDPNQIKEIREMIKKIGKEKTVILSSHILAEVEATCDRILIINRGKIVADGKPHELRKQISGNEIVKVKIEDVNINAAVESFNSIEGVKLTDILDKENKIFEIQGTPNSGLAASIFKLCAKNNWVLTELSPVEAKLEDVFMELTSIKN
jgi:ABC-2 type transport system ATP-binding protein